MIKSLIDRLFSQDEPDLKPDEPLAIAALLIEIASSDGDIAPSEMEALHHLLEKQFGCQEAEIQELVKRAKESHDDSICLYRYTSIVKQASIETRQKVIAALWKVAYADGRLDPHEEASIRKVADLLYVSHRDFIKTKHQVMEQLGTN